MRSLSTISITSDKKKDTEIKYLKLFPLKNKKYFSSFEKIYQLENNEKILLLKKENETLKNKNNDLIEKIKYVFNQTEILTNKFYSDSKTIFKNMKIYRNNILKNINMNVNNIQPEIKYKHKKSVSINLAFENDNKLSSLNDIKYKKISVLHKDKFSNSTNNIFNSPIVKIKNKNNNSNFKEKINL